MNVKACSGSVSAVVWGGGGGLELQVQVYGWDELRFLIQQGMGECRVRANRGPFEFKEDGIL